MTYFVNGTGTTRCKICDCLIPICQEICVRCEWKKQEEEENKDNKDISDIKKNTWEVNHER